MSKSVKSVLTFVVLFVLLLVGELIKGAFGDFSVSGIDVLAIALAIYMWGFFELVPNKIAGKTWSGIRSKKTK